MKKHLPNLCRKYVSPTKINDDCDIVGLIKQCMSTIEGTGGAMRYPGNCTEREKVLKQIQILKNKLKNKKNNKNFFEQGGRCGCGKTNKKNRRNENLHY